MSVDLPGGVVFDRSFAERAEQYLRKNVDAVIEQFSRGAWEGTWHPNGFAVFHVANVEELGHVRLHVWARGIRVKLDAQPEVHSHPWDLCSLVISGTYMDTLYRAEQRDQAGPGLFRGYDVKLGTAGEGDELVAREGWYATDVVDQRVVKCGEVHVIPAGALHATTVDVTGFAATLLMTSDQVDRSRLVLIGGGEFDTNPYIRPVVTENELKIMLQDVLSQRCS